MQETERERERKLDAEQRRARERNGDVDFGVKAGAVTGEKLKGSNLQFLVSNSLCASRDLWDQEIQFLLP